MLYKNIDIGEYGGGSVKTSGIKPEVIARLIDWNRIFVGRRFRLLNRMDSEWVDTCCRLSVANDPNQVLITHDDGSEVTRELMYRQPSLVAVCVYYELRKLVSRKPTIKATEFADRIVII
jgi:hypothetical protein